MSGGRGAAIERVRAALEEHSCRVDWRGDSGMAQCPAEDHDDRKASLSIAQGDKGAVLCCQAGCDTKTAILPVLNLIWRDLFDEPRKAGDRSPRRVVAEYRYTDIDGELKFIKVRYQPKDFRVKRPDGHGGWIWNIGDAPRVLYRLPEVLAAIGNEQTVYVVEGEADADRLASMDLAATTNYDGASKNGQRPKWRPEYGDTLRGADVVIIGDRDDGGLAHVSAALADLNGKAKSITAMLPAVTHKHADISDHLNAGYTLDQLIPMAAERQEPHDRRSSTKLANLDLDSENQATQIVELASQCFDLFCSPDGRAWAVEKEGPNTAIPIGRRSSKFSKRLARKFIEEYHKAPGDQAVSDAVRIITAFLDDEDPQPVYLRIASHGSSIVVDLGRAAGQCAVVTAEGWSVEPRSPVPFRRGKTGPLPIPVRSPDGLKLLRKLCNVSEGTFRLIVGCLVAYLVPGIPYVVMVIRGEQGRAKSTLAKILVRCIDPGRDPGPLPRDERNFSIRMWNGHVHAFDNVSEIAPYQSDMICRAATGADYGERTLYADDELTSMPYRCGIILNGIDLGAVPPDLADREATVEPAPIKKRRTEHTVLGAKDDDDRGVLDEFAQAHPKILGALFDLLADVLRYSPEVSKADLPRMADFAVVLGALDTRYEAIHGKPHSEPLLDLYRAMARKVVADAARDDILGSAILGFMKDKDEWDGTSGGLYDVLTAGLPKPAPEKLPRGWPANALSFGHRLPKINPALRANGWEIVRGEHSVNGRPVRVQPCPVSGAKSSGLSNRQHEDPDLREPADDTPDDDPDDLFSVDADAVGEPFPDGLFDDALAHSVIDESAGQDALGDGSDGLTISPQITGGTGPESAALTLIRQQLGAEVIGAGRAANGNRPGAGCPDCGDPDDSEFHAANCPGRDPVA